MASRELFNAGGHRNVWIEDFTPEGSLAVQANQHLIVHDGEGMILDPGGHKVYNKVLTETLSQMGGGKLRYLFASHQDPDIVAAINGWMMTTDVETYVSALWMRFIPHFGVDKLVADRLKSIPDEGMRLPLGGSEVVILPAHFLHSCGNFQVYDPVSKILYSGDLGASLGQDYDEVADFAGHVQYMEGFHRRYMTNNAALRAWGQMVRQLEIETIAPQHGAIFRGPDMVEAFIGWCEQLQCGTDVLLSDLFQVPA